jgi:hypothetical protein
MLRCTMDRIYSVTKQVLTSTIIVILTEVKFRLLIQSMDYKHLVVRALVLDRRATL